MTLKHLTGCDSGFNFEIVSVFGDKVLADYCTSLRMRFRRQRSLPQCREEWLVRIYVSLKMILSATVMLSSATYAISKNLQIVVPYLLYYALFNTSRALVFLVPEQRWNDGRLLDAMTHTKTLSVAGAQLAQVSRKSSEQYSLIFQRAQVARDFLSYRFPAKGLRGELESYAPNIGEVLDICRLVCEFAQLNSECLESEFADLDPPNNFAEAPLQRFFEYQHRFGFVHDDDDYYRLGRTLNKLARPISIRSTATEGLVEDFFGAWDNSIIGADTYGSDNFDWSMIFPFS
jgi:hypothetical protein